VDGRPAPWRPDQLPLRAARTGLLGLTAAVLAAVAHTSAGAGAPSPVLVLAAALLAATACWRASRRRLGPVRCATVTAAVQAVLHVAFSLGTPAGASAHAAHGPGMLAAHVAAGAAFGVWLAVGEAALWRVATRLAAAVAVAVRHLAHRVTALLAPAPAATLRPAAGPDATTRLRRPRHPWLRHAVVRRGPPAAAAGAPA
jgi:hypothetical protein